jgi:hypothetical protein
MKLKRPIVNRSPIWKDCQKFSSTTHCKAPYVAAIRRVRCAPLDVGQQSLQKQMLSPLLRLGASAFLESLSVSVCLR